MNRIRLVGALLLAGCGDGVPVVQPSEPAALTMSPADLFLTVGEEGRFGVAAHDAAGRPVEAPPMVWTSSDPAVASVSEIGLVTGVALGSATITARSGALHAAATVTVRPPATALPAGILIYVYGARPIIAGASVQLYAVAVDAKGTPLLGNLPITWTIDDPEIAIISNPLPDHTQIANVTGITAGTARITALSSALHASVDLTVVPPREEGPGVLTVLGFRVLELEYPSAPGRFYYAPQLLVAHSAGTRAIDVLRLEFTFGAETKTFAACTSIRLEPGQGRELFPPEPYEGYPLVWESDVRIPGDSGLAVLRYQDGSDIVRVLSFIGPVVPGSLPTTYSGDRESWTTCPP